MDSGASIHVVNNPKLLHNIKNFSSSVIGIGGSTNITGLGQLTLHVGTIPPRLNKNQIIPEFIGNITLQNVALVPESPVNLISMSAWTDQFPDHAIQIKRDLMIIIDERKKEVIAAARKIGERKTGNAWYLIGTAKKLQHAYTARTLHDWHIILGHTDPRNILRMRTANLSRGLEIDNKHSLNPDFDCIGCIKGKSTVRKFGNGPSETPKNIGDIIYCDIWGPARTTSLQGNDYFIIFVDGATHFTFIHFLKHKSDAPDKYQDLVNWIRTNKNIKIK